MNRLIVLTAAAVMSMSSVAFADEANPVVRQETVYTDPDPFIAGMTVTYNDEQGNEYRQTVVPKGNEMSTVILYKVIQLIPIFPIACHV